MTSSICTPSEPVEADWDSYEENPAASSKNEGNSDDGSGDGRSEDNSWSNYTFSKRSEINSSTTRHLIDETAKNGNEADAIVGEVMEIDDEVDDGEDSSSIVRDPSVDYFEFRDASQSKLERGRAIHFGEVRARICIQWEVTTSIVCPCEDLQCKVGIKTVGGLSLDVDHGHAHIASIIALQ